VKEGASLWYSVIAFNKFSKIEILSSFMKCLKSFSWQIQAHFIYSDAEFYFYSFHHTGLFLLRHLHVHNYASIAYFYLIPLLSFYITFRYLIFKGISDLYINKGYLCFILRHGNTMKNGAQIRNIFWQKICEESCNISLLVHFVRI
jgi:hypothetical protein